MEPDFTFSAPEPQPAPPTSRDPNALVPIVNRDARLYSIAMTLPVPGSDPTDPTGGQRKDASGRQELTPRETLTLKIHPGLNCVPLADVQRAQIVRNGRSALEMYRGRIEIADPRSLPQFDCDKLIASTHSKSALQWWHENETRDDVKAMIAKRIPLAKAA